MVGEGGGDSTGSYKAREFRLKELIRAQRLSAGSSFLVSSLLAYYCTFTVIVLSAQTAVKWVVVAPHYQTPGHP